MNDLESKITELERELALKKAFQAVKFVLPKSTPDDVEKEVQAKLREIAQGIALSKEQLNGVTMPFAIMDEKPFTMDEVSILRMLISTVQGKAAKAGEVPVSAPVSADGRIAASPGGASVHVPQVVTPRKAKVLITENVRGEGKRFVAPDDELYVSNPQKVDDHGMVSATHMKRGVNIRIPVDDVTWLD